MTTLTIPQKQSGTGHINQLNSQHFDREIEFTNDEHYAVLRPAYYDTKYTCFNGDSDLDDLIAEYKSFEGNVILGRDGYQYDLNWDELERGELLVGNE